MGMFYHLELKKIYKVLKKIFQSIKNICHEKLNLPIQILVNK